MTATDLLPIAVRAAAPAHAPLPDPALGLAWRPLTRSDAPALAELLSRTETADAVPYRTVLDEVEERLDADWKDLAHNSLVGLDPQGVPRAWVEIDQPPGDTRTVRAMVEGGVDPQWRGRGIGRAVVAWSHARARQVLAASGKELPARISTYLADQVVDGARLMARAGMRPARYYAEMRRPLDAPLPDAPAPQGVRVVPWSAELDEGARLAHNAAFADHWGSEPRTPQQWTHGRSMFAPTWSLLALDDDDRVVGYLLSGRYEADWEVVGHTAGYTELLGVVREWRGQGLASALLAAAMAVYRADGMQFAELGVDTANPTGAHRLYTQLGYEVYDSSTMYAIDL
ncbi:GNAT family N-acetyltransferase [Cellulomonas fimi]|uniref:GCN5-related N-acetyltransferase n=1 Tax=Cellulomonas fimi (strain ATCC 484 / DSM 20113 / JCM 1341 / CCUG 24087 / LMG 16345 / NBRC 15513 / NCIMB 8980 / NCTC 7547 / NRS-133) TaxID=590998 RepID=F4H1I8_CELFA|nr:GNAT family N-acetyltransferase [Cellulomonas fimi]AEE46287.1 GCN5-related N-acetyltransferase [Cellulomonas fimi ATCC 484]NNH06226.1 GNAT family N-acetyltransferase [Cellulomonas fimi]VEH32379.1 Mycothiol acetyltransferase [Cellulomonas fimi]